MKLVLFDLDGVLADTRANMEAAWGAVRKEFPGAPAFSEYFAEIGVPFSEIMRKLNLDQHAMQIERIFRQVSEANMDKVRFFDGIVEVLPKIAERKKVGVVTSKDERRTFGLLSRLPVHFDCVETPNGRQRGKPAPDHLLRAMADANVDPADTLFVGDMIVDCQAAERANCQYQQAGWGYGQPHVPQPMKEPADMLRWLD